MFETNIVIVGNVLTMPEWRRTTSSQQLVANFRVASTARRYDRENGRWVDGNSLRVRVTAWRKLAEGVTSSIRVGDPVIVYGRIFTRDWVDDDKRKRISYEMEAFSIGHDLSRGRGKFYRNSQPAALSVVDDVEDEGQVRGEAAVALSGSDVPVTYGDGVPVTSEPTPPFLEVVAGVNESADGESADTPEPEPDQDQAQDQPNESRRTRRAGKREPVAA